MSQWELTRRQEKSVRHLTVFRVLKLKKRGKSRYNSERTQSEDENRSNNIIKVFTDRVKRTTTILNRRFVDSFGRVYV